MLYAKKCILLKCIKLVGSWGFAPDPTGEFPTLSETYIAEFGWDRNVVRVHHRQIPRSLDYSIWVEINFHLNYTPECTVLSMDFPKSSGKGLTEPLPRSFPLLNLGLRLRFGVRPQISGASRPRFGLHHQFTPICSIISPNIGELEKIRCPFTSTFWLRHWGL